MTGPLSVASARDRDPGPRRRTRASRPSGSSAPTPATQAPALAALTDGTRPGRAADDARRRRAPRSRRRRSNNNFATLAAKVNALIAALKRHGLMSS